MKKFHICFYIIVFFISACSDFKGNEDDVEASLSSTPSSNTNSNTNQIQPNTSILNFSKHESILSVRVIIIGRKKQFNNGIDLLREVFFCI